MIARKDPEKGITPRNVIRGVNSQLRNEVGVHWLRISISRKHLDAVRKYCDCYFGASIKDGYGLWSYDSRYSWQNKASINFDSDFARSDLVHGGKITLDVPGSALDRIEKTDLNLFLLSLRQFKPTATRIDIFFDDYSRFITPYQLSKIAVKNHFSGFRQFQNKQQFKQNIKNGKAELLHDEVDFGRRGQNGSGKYLRCYDKYLETKGEKNCVRWEVEFTKERAQIIFDKLSLVTSIDAFATLCGSLVVGCITFVHRCAEKNIGRLCIYKFWENIKGLLGTLVIRVPSHKTNLSGKYEWVYRQVSPTLACLRETFVTDSYYLSWLFDVLAGGKDKMSQAQVNVSNENKKTLHYIDGEVLRSKCGILCGI